MLHLIGILTALGIVITGGTVIALGDWKKFTLKYAGVAISTLGGLWFFTSMVLSSDPIHCNLTSSQCFSFEIYGIARNIAFIIFHIAFGRDAIQFRKNDRRQSV